MNPSEPLDLEKNTMGHWWISQLKNVDVSFIESNVIKKEHKGNLERLLNIFADDLISINHGDYQSYVRINIDALEVSIKLEKGYPFIAETAGQAVEGLKYIFSLEDCSDDASIHKAIDLEIQSHLEEGANNWLNLKPFTNLNHVENYYQQMRILDKIFFEKPVLLPNYSYYGSIYEDEKKMAVRSINIEPKSEVKTPMLKIYIGLIKIVITNGGMLFQHKDNGNIRKVLKANEATEDQIQKEFIKMYNEIYDTNYTNYKNVKEVLLVHDMIEI